ncbi:MAG: hypothetical protein IT385_11525 [Deltaproteobacteria bacterium]|nr:hypothetical protein [Deltaproteobacteria bacterium]
MSAVKNAYAVGKECDAWCTKCKRDTLHNIVALDASGLPAQVECRSCGGGHKYRAPKAPVAAAAAKTAKAPAKRVPAKTAKQQAAAALPAQIYKRWEELVGKRAGTPAQRYIVTESYGPDDVVEHTQFGLGFVLESTAWNRIKVIFQDAERTLIARHGQKPPA